MKNRLWLKWILVLILVFTVSSVSIGEKKVELTVWTLGIWSDMFAGAESVLNHLYPNIEINVVPMGLQDMADRFLVALAGGEADLPDLVTLHQRVCSQFIKTGGLLEITDNFKPHATFFSDGLLSAVSVGERYYAVPLDYAPIGINLNVAELEKYGINYREIDTWDEFIATAKHLKEASNGTKYMFHQYIPSGDYGANNFLLFLFSRGGNVWDRNGELITDNQIARETMRWYWDMHSTHGISMHIHMLTPSFWQAIKEKELLCWVMNPSASTHLNSNVPEQAGDWRVLAFPKWGEDAPSTTGIWGGTTLAITKTTRHPKEAWEIAEFFACTEQGQGYVMDFGLFPAYEKAKASPVFHSSNEFFGGQNAFDEIARRTTTSIYYYHWDQTTEIIGNQIDLLFRGRKTPEEAWDDAEAELADLLW